MKRRIALRAAMFLSVAMAGMFTARAETACSAAAADEPKVVEAVRTMYAAATADDLALFHTVTTADFYAYDNGQRFDGDALMNLMKKMHAAGWVYVWNVTEPQVRLDCNTAAITLVTKGSFTPPKGTAQDASWLESAFLEKQSGQWRIRFYDSTRVPTPDAH
jgi:hypothetical protein